MKNTLEGIDSRIYEAEEQISELEDKMVEITSEDQNKVKRIKRTEDSLRDLWDNRTIYINNYCNVNRLNTPTKRHRLAEWIQKQNPYVCCLQGSHF